jgi:hypothetical protein
MVNSRKHKGTKDKCRVNKQDNAGLNIPSYVDAILPKRLERPLTSETKYKKEIISKTNIGGINIVNNIEFSLPVCLFDNINFKIIIKVIKKVIKKVN